MTTVEANARQSNFEALRLLCMLMVLNLHSFSGYSHGSGVWQALDFFRECTSICAVDCFILISGYFGIRWKWKSFFNLIFQIFFYSVGIYLLVTSVGIVEWDMKDFLMRFACLAMGSWDFAIYYVLLYFCAPALNALAEKSTARELLLYILVLFLVINFISIPRFAFFTFALVYLIGRYLRKANFVEKNIPVSWAYWITTVLIFVCVYFLLFKVLHITDSEVIGTWPVGIIGFDYAAPLVIMQAVLLFLTFAKMNLSSKFINWCATSCFAIYLIHLHPTIKEIGYYSFTRNLYELPVLKHILLLVPFILLVFFGCILIDQIRLIISRKCYSLLEKAAGSFRKKISSFYVSESN